MAGKPNRTSESSPRMIAPGATIGILGGGQLGRMLALAAARLGYHTHIFCPEADAPAIEVATLHTCADYSDADELRRFGSNVDVITLEFENIPAAPLATLKGLACLRPGSTVLDICQHRIREKEFIQSAGIPCAAFAAARSSDELKAALQRIGTPAIAKTCQFGYDGKGQVRIEAPEGAEQAWKKLATDEAIIESVVDFTMEISVIAARNPQGDITCFPPVNNVHRHHMLHQTIVPAHISSAVARRATDIARTLAERLSLEGLLAVEMFVTRNNDLLVNELAPRPHNSGHWTLDACATSQFEQAIRAVCGLPLGATDMLCPAMMTNLVGEEILGWETHMRNPRAKLHIYGKKEPRPGRKMGHVTELLPKA